MTLTKAFLSLTLAALCAAPTMAQGWPSRPISVVVPFKAGGSSDLVARSFAAAIEENSLLGQPVSVVNVSGHSSVGARRVMDAAPDGYEFLVHETGLLGAEAAGIINFGYKDYKPVALTGVNCMAILVRKDSGYDNLNDLLAAASKDSGSIPFGVNIGGLNHMSGILLENTADAKFRFAQVGGSADNFAALTGGQTAVASVGAAGARNFTMTKDGELAEDSQVKAIALLADTTDPRLPNVPTAKQQGVDVSFCFGNYWLAPKSTPDEVVSAFASALEQASETDRIKAFYDDSLTTPEFLRGDAFAAYLDEQAALIGPVAKQATAK
ncbi:Bug family tripartite tricarboxylate transporter substrate binding protein [Marinobacterium rhizophilum]|uniref:Tripartite tricarboxylate transporter substrate binding protein n=1 Tax=Marinobacterium rhizophilum TaxID=420402 RepID=A0ABY5HHF7_9GAMM|nr:tripartite tricarboxylate transporter substrate binding protein [Marinobacterium rhizophilum]UTW11414.1 tripartite tricarboxylate transporter substrate binding protein [Marinobacterium rhizophilum]